MKRTSHKGIAVAAGLLTIVTALAISVDLSEWLRGGYGWRWPYEPLELVRVLPLIALVGVYIGSVHRLLRRPRRTGFALAWSIGGTLLIVLAAVAAREGDAWFALFARTASNLGTGPHWVASHIDWEGGAWRDWSAQMAFFGGHLRNLPPGSIMWYAGLSALFDQLTPLSSAARAWLMPLQCQNFDLLAYTPGQWASMLFGMAMPLWAALTPLALYAAARRIVPDSAQAVILWYPLIPGLSGFAGTWNTVYPLLALLALLAILIGCRDQRLKLGWIGLSGLITGIGLFINFALMPLPLLLGLWVLFNEVVIRRRMLARAIAIGVTFALGLAAVWIVFWLVSGETPFDLLATAMGFHLGLDRPYAFWVVMHTWDWLLWGGLAFGIVTFALLARWIVRGRAEPIPVLSAALALTMLIMVLSGSARGETGRVWLFFAPFLLIAAAESWNNAGRPLAQPSWLWLAVPQGALLVALTAAIAGMGTAFTRPQPPAPVETAHAVDVMFAGDSGGAFRLVGWDGAVRDDSLELRLNWQAVERSEQPIWFGAVLVGSDGTTLPVEAWQPAGAAYPTTCWGDGLIGDAISVPLAGHLDAEWWVSVAAFGDPAQLEGRLAVQLPDGTFDSQVGLGPIGRD